MINWFTVLWLGYSQILSVAGDICLFFTRSWNSLYLILQKANTCNQIPWILRNNLLMSACIHIYIIWTNQTVLSSINVQSLWDRIWLLNNIFHLMALICWIKKENNLYVLLNMFFILSICHLFYFYGIYQSELGMQSDCHEYPSIYLSHLRSLNFKNCSAM